MAGTAKAARLRQASLDSGNPPATIPGTAAQEEEKDQGIISWAVEPHITVVHVCMSRIPV